jgi:hypothetical protein
MAKLDLQQSVYAVRRFSLRSRSTEAPGLSVRDHIVLLPITRTLPVNEKDSGLNTLQFSTTVNRRTRAASHSAYPRKNGGLNHPACCER